jgi:5-methylcytosine-specific restriction protein B
MNTADRSIALLDLALRRRFTFLELMPDPSLVGSVDSVNLSGLLQRLNARIVALLDRDHQIGHSYLYGVADITALRFAWYHRIVPLLREYFYNDGERLRAVLGSAFVTTEAMPADLFEKDVDLLDLERGSVVVNDFAGDDPGFLIALRQIVGGQTGAENVS